jgi:hypothetical protein
MVALQENQIPGGDGQLIERRREEHMVPAYNESFRQIDDLCVQLLLFVEAARRSESQGECGILAYGFISECASKIRITAEEQRQKLARTQWKHAVGEDMGDLHRMDVQRAFRS